MDIIATNEDYKQIMMVDVTILFKNRQQAFIKAHKRKQDKYQPQADTLRSWGYNLTVKALMVGGLLAWDPSNKSILHNYAKWM